MTPIETAAVLIGVGVVVVVRASMQARSPKSRAAIRSALGQRNLPFLLRNASLVAPALAPALWLLGAALLLPRPLAYGFALGACAATAVAFAVPYLAPDVIRPAWLRSEIREGLVRPAKPDTLDWLLFWIIEVVLTVGCLGILVWIIVLPSPT